MIDRSRLSLNTATHAESDNDIESVLVCSADPELSFGLGVSLEHRFKMFFTSHGSTLCEFVQAFQPDLLIYAPPPSSQAMHILELLRREHPRLQIILITNPLSRESDFARRASSIADSVFVMPIDFRELFSAINNLKRYHCAGSRV